MEILEVQTIIPGLLSVSGMEFGFADFEFERKKNMRDKKNGVDSVAHSWYHKLKVNDPWQIVNDLLEDPNLFDPSISLCGKNCELGTPR